MADTNLLETYNPLYDVHLRQYFASPHMQKHLRSLGLLDSNGVPLAQQENNVEGQLYARHQVMMDLMLRNRERVLMQLADLQKKLDAAEKVEIYRRIRSGITNAEEFRRHHLATRSFSRPARAQTRESGTNERQRRHSNSYDESELVKRIEHDFDTAQNDYAQHHKNLYSRLAANAYKYQYLHKLDDRTLLNYKETLRRQLQKLERFREVSFGPHSVAKHQPNLQTSWFFRRRSLPSLTVITNSNTAAREKLAPLKQRNSKSVNRQRSGKSCSPSRVNRLPAATPSQAVQRKSKPKQAPRKLPPLPKQKSKTKTNTSSGSSTATQKLPPTAVVKPSKKREKEAENRSSSGASFDKLPKLAAGGALLAGGALAATTLAVHSDSEPHHEISDTDYSQPDTEASDVLPSDAEQSIGASPQPHSDIEPENVNFKPSLEPEPEMTPKRENVHETAFNYENSAIEDPIHKTEIHAAETVIDNDFTPVEEHIRNVRSVENSNDEQAQYQSANDSAVYSSNSNGLQDSFRSDNEDTQSQGTHNADRSAFSPENLSGNEDVNERNDTPISKDSIEAERERYVENEMPNREESPVEYQHREEEAHSEDDYVRPESPSIQERHDDYVRPESPSIQERQEVEFHADSSSIQSHQEIEAEIHAGSPSIQSHQEIEAEIHANSPSIQSHQQEEAYSESNIHDDYVRPESPSIEERHNETEIHADSPSIQSHQEIEAEIHADSPSIQSHQQEEANLESDIHDDYVRHESPSIQSHQEIEAEIHADSPSIQSHQEIEAEIHAGSPSIQSHQQEEADSESDYVRHESPSIQSHQQVEAHSESDIHDDYVRPESPSIQERHDEVEAHSDSPSIQSHTELSESENIQPFHETQNIMSQSVYHKSENEQANEESESTSLKNYPREHRDSFAESESEPNIHHQARFNNNFDLSNDNSIPIMEGESLQDSEETEPLDGDSFAAVEATPQEVEQYEQMAVHDNDSIHHDDQVEEPQIRQSAHLLVAQPSIEITPASDYSGSREHLDQIGQAITPEVPKTPSSASDHNDDSGHPTEHDGIDSDNQLPSDDVEVIPPPTRHSPLTDPEDNSQHYHLPESPDPHAHSTIIPEQHDDALVVPEIEDPVPRDHFPEDSDQQSAPETERLLYDQNEDTNGNYSMETTYQHEFNDHQNNGHHEKTFNGNGYHQHEEIEDEHVSLTRKSVGGDEESDSASVIIRGSPEPEQQKLQSNTDAHVGASEI